MSPQDEKKPAGNAVPIDNGPGHAGHAGSYGHDTGFAPYVGDAEVGVLNKVDPLKQDLKGRHMQMIAIGTRFSLSLFLSPCKAC